VGNILFADMDLICWFSLKWTEGAVR
jgi:hypothetical protein